MRRKPLKILKENLKPYNMIKRNYINNKPIIEINNFLTSKECDKLLVQRAPNFSTANSHYPKYYRNNNRLEEDNIELSKFLFESIKGYNLSELKESVRLNEKIRFCEYSKNQEFSKHQDGIYYSNEKEASALTFLLYLNGDNEFEGGQTQFFISKQSKKVELEISPQKGKLVVFDHSIWHNAQKVINGAKYILRSDILFKIRSNKDQHQGYIWCLAKLKNNTFLSGGRDSFIRHWDKDLKLIRSFKLHSKSIIKIVEIENGQFISSSRDLTLKKWDIKGNKVSNLTTKYMVLSMVVLGGFLVVGNTNGEIIIIDNELNELSTFKVHEGWVWDICTKDNTIYSVSDDGFIKATQLNGTTSTLLRNNESLFCLSINDNTIYAGSQNGYLITLNLKPKTVDREKVHQDIIRRIYCHKNLVITCGEDNKVLAEHDTITSHNNFVQDLIVIDNCVISAGFDGEIKKTLLQY